MRFVWDLAKERRNVDKHGLDFSYAQRIFSDPRVLVAPDRIVDQEERWHAIGVVDATRVLLVVHSYPYDDRDDLIRVIGIRRATRSERIRYDAPP